MIAVIWTPEEMPVEAHVIVVTHTDGMPNQEKGYFFMSGEDDWGGSGPFDMKLDEVLERAKNAAVDEGFNTVIVTRRKQVEN